MILDRYCWNSIIDYFKHDEIFAYNQMTETLLAAENKDSHKLWILVSFFLISKIEKKFIDQINKEIN